jgi:hypothetical protein
MHEVKAELVLTDAVLALKPREREVLELCLAAGVYQVMSIRALTRCGDRTASAVVRVIREQFNLVTRHQLAAQKRDKLREVLGTRDPRKVTNSELALACGLPADASIVSRFMTPERRAWAKKDEAAAEPSSHLPEPVIAAAAKLRRQNDDRAEMFAKVLGNRDPRDVSLASFAEEAGVASHLVERWLSTEKRRMAIVDPDEKRRAPKPVVKVKYNDGCDLPPPIRPPRGRRVKCVVDGDEFAFVEKQ